MIERFYGQFEIGLIKNHACIAAIKYTHMYSIGCAVDAHTKKNKPQQQRDHEHSQPQLNEKAKRQYRINHSTIHPSLARN